MVHLVTGYAGYAHIKSADDGAFNASFFGGEQYVMEFGNQFQGSIIDNNTVRILDGDGLMYGRHFRIEPNTYEDLTIETGTADTNRIDLICMTYEKNADDETEKVYLQVVKGTQTAGSPSIPEYIDGNILEGASYNQMPLYKVTIEGVVLSGIEAVFETIPSYEGLAKMYADRFEAVCEALKTEFDLANIIKRADVVDNLTSVDTNKPLSANMGKKLADNSILGLGELIQVGDDLNDYRAFGVYSTISRETTETLLNSPITGSFRLLVIPARGVANDQYIKQIILPAQGNYFYMRQTEAGYWKSWKCIGDVVDNLTSTSTNMPLSANQGRKIFDEYLTPVTSFTADNLTIGNLCGGTLSGFNCVKYGRLVILYFQINDITTPGKDVTLFTINNDKYRPVVYGIHNAYINRAGSTAYIGQFVNGNFSIRIGGTDTIDSNNKAMVIATIAYISKS